MKALAWSGSIPAMSGGSAGQGAQSGRGLCPLHAPRKAFFLQKWDPRPSPRSPLTPCMPHCPTPLIFFSASLLLHFSESRN